MALNDAFEQDITARIERDKKRKMAASMGKSVQEMEEDNEHFKELAAIDSETKQYEAEEAASEEIRVVEEAEFKKQNQEQIGAWTEPETQPPWADFQGEEFPSEGVVQGKEAAMSGFPREEDPDWDKNSANPAVRAQLAQEGLDEPMGIRDPQFLETGRTSLKEQAEEFARDEKEPAVEQMKKVQDNPKDREEVFRGMPKEEKAMAKEELGNYYIGPGGYAINLNTLEASRERAVNMSLLQFVPDHAKAQMLASWGYIDQEDVDKSPDSPAYMLEELKGVNANALQKLKNEKDITITDKNISGRDALATKLYTSKAEINAANNTLTETLENRRIDVRELELDASLFMHGDKLDMEQYLADNKLQLSKEELQQLDTHFTKKLSFEYSQMLTNDDYRNRVVDQGDAQFNRKFARLDKQDQEAMIMAQFNRQQKTVDMYLEAGQFESAVLASAGMPSRLVGFNQDTYFKNKAKTSGTDPIFTAAMGMSTNLQGYLTGSKEDVRALRNKFYGRKDQLVRDLMKEKDPDSGEPSYLDTQMAALGMVQFNDLPAKSVKTSEGKIITAGKDEYNNNRMQYRSAMRIKAYDQIMKKDPTYGQLYNNINNARTHFQTTGSLDTFGGGGGGKTKPPVVVKKPEIKTKTETVDIPKKEPESGPLPGEPRLVVAPGKRDKAPYKRLDKAFKSSEREHRQAIRKESVVKRMSRTQKIVYDNMLKKKKDKMEKDQAALKKYILQTHKWAAKEAGAGEYTTN